MKKILKDKIKTWFVTGASSGIGYEMCKQLLQRGYNVIAVSRRTPDFVNKDVLCLSVDVTNPESIKNAVEKGIEKFGKIDVLVNNAGISADVLCEEESIQHMKKVMDTNFFGTFNTINLLLPHFRDNYNGTIINNTSQSGLSGRLRGSAYVSSKHAVEGLTSVVRLETQKFCRVMAFELGWFSGTEIIKNNLEYKYKEIDKDAYKNLNDYYTSYLNSHINQLEIAVQFIIEEVEKEKIQQRLILGRDAYFRIKTSMQYLNKSLRQSKSRALKCSEFDKKFPLKVIRKVIKIILKKEILKNI